MIWLQIFAATAMVYLLVGLFVAFVQVTAYDMPWQLFVFMIIFWPSL
jgi:hypothetical protein